MKTFTATQLNKRPQEVFAAAKEDGAVLVKHDRHPGRFAIVWNKDYSEGEVLLKEPAHTSIKYMSRDESRERVKAYFDSGPDKGDDNEEE